MSTQEAPRLILSLDELFAIVGCPRKPVHIAKAVIIEWLQGNRFQFLLNRQGWPIVSRSHVELKLGGVTAQHTEPEADRRLNMQAMHGGYQPVAQPSAVKPPPRSP
jgi:hypothetical protein